MNQEYQNLEKILQKYEQDIRKHIRVEQQLKLFSETLQQKIEECEQEQVDLLNNTKQIMIQIKNDNQKLNEQNQQYKQDLEMQNQLIQNFNDKDIEYQQKLQEYKSLQERINILERIVQVKQFCLQSKQQKKENNSKNQSNIQKNAHKNNNFASNSSSLVRKINIKNLQNNCILTKKKKKEPTTINKNCKQTPKTVFPSPLKVVRKTKTSQLLNNSVIYSRNSEQYDQSLNNTFKNICLTQPISINQAQRYSDMKQLQSKQKSQSKNMNKNQNNKFKELSQIYQIKNNSRFSLFFIIYTKTTIRNETKKSLQSYHLSTNSSINNSYSNAINILKAKKNQYSSKLNATGGNNNGLYRSKKCKNIHITQNNKEQKHFSNNINDLSNMSKEYSDYLNQEMEKYKNSICLNSFSKSLIVQHLRKQ